LTFAQSGLAATTKAPAGWKAKGNVMVGMLGIFGLLFALAAFCLAVLGTVFWIWMLVDCATKESSQGNEKLIWILIILFTHFLGALLYFLVRRPKRMSGLGG